MLFDQKCNKELYFFCCSDQSNKKAPLTEYPEGDSWMPSPGLQNTWRLVEETLTRACKNPWEDKEVYTVPPASDVLLINWLFFPWNGLSQGGWLKWSPILSMLNISISPPALCIVWAEYHHPVCFEKDQVFFHEILMISKTFALRSIVCAENSEYVCLTALQ